MSKYKHIGYGFLSTEESFYFVMPVFECDNVLYKAAINRETYTIKGFKAIDKPNNFKEASSIRFYSVGSDALYSYSYLGDISSGDRMSISLKILKILFEPKLSVYEKYDIAFFLEIDYLIEQAINDIIQEHPELNLTSDCFARPAIKVPQTPVELSYIVEYYANICKNARSTVNSSYLLKSTKQRGIVNMFGYVESPINVVKQLTAQTVLNRKSDKYCNDILVTVSERQNIYSPGIRKQAQLHCLFDPDWMTEEYIQSNNISPVIQKLQSTRPMKKNALYLSTQVEHDMSLDILNSNAKFANSTGRLTKSGQMKAKKYKAIISEIKRNNK